MKARCCLVSIFKDASEDNEVVSDVLLKPGTGNLFISHLNVNFQRTENNISTEDSN